MNSIHKPNGFTIVELLIVIVILGILAAISLVAYGGVQSRARVAIATSDANSWKKVISSYTQISGSFLAPQGTAICLGDSYPAEAGFSAGTCTMTNGSPAAQVNPAAMTLIKNEGLSLPSNINRAVSFNDGMFRMRGFLLQTNGSNQQTISYYLEAEQSCGSFTKNYDTGGNITFCYSNF